LIANVNLVPSVGDGWVIQVLDDNNGENQWKIPDRTLVSDEHYLDCLQQQVREEVGIKLLSCKIMGAIHCNSYAEKPHHPHLLNLSHFD